MHCTSCARALPLDAEETTSLRHMVVARWCNRDWRDRDHQDATSSTMPSGSLLVGIALARGIGSVVPHSYLLLSSTFPQTNLGAPTYRPYQGARDATPEPVARAVRAVLGRLGPLPLPDRKSTRLNSSH